MKAESAVDSSGVAGLRNIAIRTAIFSALLWIQCFGAGARADDAPPSAQPTSATSSETSSEAVTSGAIETTRTWVSYVGLGAQFLPDYNDQGKSEGFNKQQFFADLFVDGRFTDDCSSPGDTDDKKALIPANWCGFGSAHAGVRLTFLGAPVVRDDNTGVAPTKFTDVSNALVFAPYMFWSILQGVEQGPGKDKSNRKYVHNLGPLIRGGIISRDRTDASGDTASWFAQLGLQYTYESYRFSKENYVNGLPQGFANVSWARFEDYANLGKRDRLVVEAGYRVLTKTRLYLGFKANLGSGPDDFGAFLAYYFAPDKLVEIFGVD